ncbi:MULTISPECIES: ClpXP protease specificity-enhancing factor SspB [Roseobacteraceae]|uniref:SspB family protein n=1 Tax=Roseobacteraceae TaxID=2854170 RepID=UPI00329A5331
MSNSIDYGNLMHDAMRGLIRKVLDDVAAHGLPGAHHFFITFDTSHPDAELADWLSDRYPGEMTVVMQHWYDGLEVGDLGFSITLNFGDAPEPLYIPYDAIKTFVDPSVEFGLRFETQDEGDDATADTGATPLPVAAPKDPQPAETPADTDDKKEKDADVVSLDSFRK